MANDLTKSIFFAGGKTVFPITTETTGGLTFTKQNDGAWNVKIELIIPEIEAKGIIGKYKDFEKPADNEDFEKLYHNQVFFEAFDATDKSVKIKFSRVVLNVLNEQKTQEGGEIVLRMTPNRGVGKTDNPQTKTDNATIIIAPGGQGHG